MAISPTDAHQRLALLGRGAPRPAPPLFLPLCFTVAAGIEAVAPLDLALDETKLVRAGSELARVTGQPALFTSIPTGAVAEALGAELDLSSWPPRVTGRLADVDMPAADPDRLAGASRLLAAGLSATRNLAADEGNRLLPLVALEGPVALHRQLYGETPLTEARADALGAVLAALIAEYAKAGAEAVVLYDTPAGVEELEWVKAIYRTACNVARFHRKPLIAAGQLALGLPALVQALAPEEAPGPMQKAHARLWPETPEAWAEAPFDPAARIVLTRAEVPHDTALERLFALGAAALARFD